MAIAFGSINTGLPKDIVQQVMKAERIPVAKMEARKAKIDERKKLVSELSTLVGEVRKNIRDNSNYRSLKELAVETNKNLVEVQVDKTIARPSIYQFEVVRLAQKSSAMTSGFADRKDSYTGVGYIQYSLPNGEQHEIYIDSAHANLDGIAELINKNSKSNLQASVVNDGSGSPTPWRIVLSLKETGDSNKAKFPYFYFVDGEQDLFLEFERKAQDGVIKLDGFEIEVPENTVKDIIPGVTIELKKAKPEEEFSIKISEDKKKITEKISTIIDSLNGVLIFIRQQNNIDENTDTSRTLGGDILIQTVESRLRTAIFKPVPTSGGTKRLSDLGITFQKDGLLKLESEKLESYLAEKYDIAAEILVGTISPDGKRVNGVLNNALQVVESMLALPNGIINSRQKSLRNKIDEIDRQIDTRERLLEQKEKNLKDKFARLEETIAKIKTQGAGLASLGVQTKNIAPQLG